MDMSASFGYWVRRRRKALDLTQAELARRVGCAEVTIHKIEVDERRPSSQIAALLAEHLRIPLEEQADFLGSARGQLAVDQLKDITRPEPILQAVVPDPPSDFAPLKTRPPAVAPTRRTNLPHQPTALIGREKELAAIQAILRRADVRLLTLTGPGGIGKTRLALQTVAEVLHDFAQGAYFVNLAPISDPVLVVATIAQTLGIAECGNRPLLEHLKDELREQELLLLLDNFEQVLDAAQQLAELLAGCPKLKLLITSREVLHLYGEHEFEVPPLSLPERAQLPPLSRFTQFEAVRLFIERAQAAKADFAVTNASAPAVVEICFRLDGLPLAIELAAAQIKLFGPEALLSRLEHRLALLTGGGRDQPARHQTIRGAIDWSYNLLSEAEQALFARLGVFVGGCTLDAAEAVCNADGALAIDVTDGVASLVDKSLLRLEAGMDGEPRVLMLETIREYALERLEASGEADALHRRHATYFRDTAQSYTSRAESARWNRLESDNLRAALAWSQSAAGDSALALDLVVPVWRIEFTRGDYQGARRQLKQALEYAEGLVDTQRYAEASASLGYLIGSMGELAACRPLVEQAYTLYQKLGDKRGEASALELLGWVALEQGDAATARFWLEQGVALNRELGDKGQLNYALVHLAAVAVLEEDVASAERLLEESLALNRESYDQQSFAWSLNHLGHAAQLRGDYELAAQLHQESLALFIDLLGEKQFCVAEAWQSLGQIALAQGDLVAAREWMVAALRVCDELGDRSRITWCLAGLGSAAALDEEPERAARLWGAAEQLRAALGCRLAPATRVSYVHSMAIARAQLGEEAFAVAWAAGRAMALEQAIAEALDGTNESRRIVV